MKHPASAAYLHLHQNPGRHLQKITGIIIHATTRAYGRSASRKRKPSLVAGDSLLHARGCYHVTAVCGLLKSLTDGQTKLFKLHPRHFTPAN